VPETFVKSVKKGFWFPIPLSPGQAGELSVPSLKSRGTESNILVSSGLQAVKVCALAT
jgi:hypothetical protein